MNVQKSILRVFNWSNWTRLFFCHSCCDCWREMSYQDPEDDGREEATNEALPGLLGRQLQEEWRRQRHKQHQRLNEEEEEEGRTWRRRRIKRRTHLDEGRAAEEEAKHVGHDVVTDDAGDRHDEPGRQQKNHSSNSSILLVMYFVQFFFFLTLQLSWRTRSSPQTGCGWSGETGSPQSAGSRGSNQTVEATQRSQSDGLLW